MLAIQSIMYDVNMEVEHGDNPVKTGDLPSDAWQRRELHDVIDNRKDDIVILQ